MPSDSDVEVDEPIPEVVTGRARRKKKGKKKPPTATSQRDWSPSLEVKNPENLSLVVSLQKPNQHTAPSNVADLLVVNVKNLDPLAELGRLFGATTIREGPQTSQQPQHQYHVKRGTLVRIKRTWPPVVRFGLDMERLPEGSYTFTHSKQYRNVQKLFYQALESMDPNNLTHILADHPYHVDTLLQLSDVMRHQEDADMSADLLERVMHAYQSAFHACFNPVIGTCRLSYRHQENRGLFIALFRYVSHVGSRGCYRNALDYCKILFSLDVDGDPLATLLMIDCYALLSRQLDFLIDFYDCLNPSRNLYLLPNFAYSVALAVFLAGDANSIYRNRDPDLLTCIALLSLSKLLTRERTHNSRGEDRCGRLYNYHCPTHCWHMSEPDSLGRLLDLYVSRTQHLWTDPRVSSWLERNAEIVLLQVEKNHVGSIAGSTSVDPRLKQYSELRRTLYRSLPQNIIRHLVLADIAEAPPILPRDMSQVYSFDPLPPANSIDIYNPEEERRRLREARRAGDGSLLSTFLASILPDYALNQARQDLNVDDPQNQEGAGSSTQIRQSLNSAVETLVSAVRRVFETQQEQPDQDDSRRAETDGH